MSHQHTTKALVQQKLAETRLREAQAKARQDFLSRLATGQLGFLDLLLQQEIDKVEVLASTITHVAVRSEGKLEELLSIITKSFESQTQNIARAKAQAESKQGPVPAEQPSSIIQAP